MTCQKSRYDAPVRVRLSAAPWRHGDLGGCLIVLQPPWVEIGIASKNATGDLKSGIAQRIADTWS